jgi:hypothetical protein
MKKVNLIFVAMLISSIGFSQFIPAGLWNNKFGITKSIPLENIKAIEIGHSVAVPKAALHVNAHYLDPPTVPSTMFYPGQVFRTDGPSNRDNMWQLFTGSDYNSATEKGRFYVPANSIDLVLQASAGSLLFNTNGKNTQMKLDTNGFLTINTLATGNNTLILANNNGTLVPTNIENTIAQSNTIIELKKQITELQAQVKELLLANKN